MSPSSLDAVKDSLSSEAAARPGNWLAIFSVRYALTVLPLACLVAAGSVYPSWYLFCAIALGAGFTQNALGILMHESSHFFFHPNKKVNDALANVLVCLPIFNTVQGYRTTHLSHHQLSGSREDPYFELYGKYLSRSDVIKGFIRDFAGITAVRSFLQRYVARDGRSSNPPRYLLSGLIAVQSVIFVAAYYLTGSWVGYFVLWILPLLTIPIGINRLRTIVEHTPVQAGTEINRSTVPTLLEYLCIAPYGYSYHFEHHMMPAIPYYRLQCAHLKLAHEGVDFTENELAQGYLATFFRLVRGLSRPSSRKVA